MLQPLELPRQQNRANVLAVIQEQGPISRVELASLLGLNPATITRITRDLIEDGLVKEEGQGKSKGAGRKRILLRFNHGIRLVIGVHADSRQVTGVIANLANDILTRRTALRTAELSLSLLTSLIDELLEENPGYRQHLAAICLGSSRAEEISPFIQGLEQEFQVPMLASDTVTMATMGEAEAGCMKGQQVFALFYLGTASYSCVYLQGQTRIGQLGLAHDGSSLAERICDAGLLETFTSIREQDVPSALDKGAGIRLIFEAARRDDPAARQAIEKIVDDLALAVLWIANALNIEHVVIAGPWARAADVLIPLLETRLQVSTPTISVAQPGDEASLIGAVRLAIGVGEPGFKVANL